MRRLISAVLIAVMLSVSFQITAFGVSPDITLNTQKLSKGGFTDDLKANYKDPLDKTKRCIQLKRQDNPAGTTESWMSYIPKNTSGYNIKGDFSLSYKIYFDEFVGYSNLFFEETESGSKKSFAQLYINDEGMLSVGAWSLKQLEAKKWYEIKLVISTDKKQMSVYLDGQRLSTIKDGSKVSHSWVSSENCSEIRFQIGSEYNGKYILFKNISIKPEKGLADVSDVVLVSLKNADETVGGLSGDDETLSLQCDIRIENNNKIMLIGTMYDENNMLTDLSELINADKSGTYTMNFQKSNTKGKILKCFAWADGLVPVGMQYFTEKSATGADYGVFPDTDSDVTKALQNAINQLPDGGTLTLAKGTYRISASDFSLYCLNVSGKKGITIDGNGSEFIVTDRFSGAFSVSDSEDITLENFTIDYENVPWQSGIVTAVDKKNSYFELTASGENCLFDNFVFQDRIGSVFFTLRDEKNPTLQKASANEHYRADSIKALGNNRYGFYTSEWCDGDLYGNTAVSGGILNVGDMVTFIARTYTGSNFLISKSGDVRIKNVTSYASAECGVKGTNLTGNICLDNFDILLNDNRELATTADGVHIQFSRGALIMENCEFEGLSDDCVNLYQTPLLVTAVSDEKITLYSHGNLKTGDTLTFFDYKNNVLKGEADVTATEGNTLILGKTLENVSAGDYVYINEGMFNGSVIKNCEFKNSRRYGLYLKCHNITVEGNLFKNLGSNAVTGGFLSDEGFNLENAVFKNNTVEGCGYLPNGQSGTSASFSVNASSSDGVYLHKNISFIGNKIIGAEQNAFYIISVDGLYMKDNVIENPASGCGETVVKNCILSEN